jgi:hypothetical protein
VDEWSAYLSAMTEGRYFEAHEILEAPWRQTHSYRLKIAIWIAAAFVHWSRQRPQGAIRLFTRVLKDPQAADLPIADQIIAWITAVEHGSPTRPPSLADLKVLVAWANPNNR